jgi:hypothetical protein
VKYHTHCRIVHWIYLLVSVWLFIQLSFLVWTVLEVIRGYNLHDVSDAGRQNPYWWNVVKTLLHPLLMVVVLSFLLDIMRSLRKKIAFDPAVIQQVKWIGIIFLIYAGIKYLVFMVIGPWLNFVKPDILFYSYALVTGLWILAADAFFGLLILALAQIFKYGYELQKEQDLTV